MSFLAALALLLPSAKASASVLSLKESLRYALEHSPALEIVRQRARVSGLQTNVARSKFLPSLDVSATPGLRGTDPSENSPTAPFTSTLSLGVTETLWDNGRSWNAWDISRVQQQSAELRALQTRDQTFLDIATQFYTYSLNLKLAEAQQRQLEILQKKLRSVRGQFREGMSQKKDFLRFKNQVQRSEIAVLTARLNIDKALLALQRLLGSPAGESIGFQAIEPPAEAPSIPGEPPPVERAYEHRIAYNDARLGPLQVTQAKRDYWPNLNLSGGLSYNNSSFLNSPAPFSAGQQWLATAQLQIAFNLWDWGQRRDNIAIARSNELIYDKTLTQAEQQVRADTRTLMLTLTQLKANYTLSEQLLAGEETTYEVILRDYEEGRVQYLDLINSLSTLLDAKNSVYSAYFDLMSGLARYHYYNGNLYDTLVAD